VLVASVSYLNKYQAVPVAHDQVYLTTATVEVLVERLQSALFEKAAGQ
jgi:hypothetical protein